MQRGRFCPAGELHDLYLFCDSRMLIAILIVISVPSIGLFTFSSFGIAQLPGGAFLCIILGSLIAGYFTIIRPQKIK
ncbi:YeeE/YedE thiosulfate transporter family protein [Morganella psychrotolerans]|uniref:Uncharacterized protein n=1 Tax=Morganella psychrotolerans TaxID=368603 RepID=A0A1B8H6Q4_9GAMM|nr:YeeE/YedE thiosulfate transporter family protein [Morganella psychrotolerans]OBU04759.1 hypothetical protein AYY17_07595 [Morganella psychrotolerans]